MKTLKINALRVHYWIGTSEYEGTAKTIRGAKRIANRNKGNTFGPSVSPVQPVLKGLYEVGFFDNYGTPDYFGILPNGEKVELFAIV